MNFKVVQGDGYVGIQKTGAALLDGVVFGDIKMARAVVVDIVEARIRSHRTKRNADLDEVRKRAVAVDEALFKSWREQRDAVTTTREKDLPNEPAAEPAPAPETAE